MSVIKVVVALSLPILTIQLATVRGCYGSCAFHWHIFLFYLHTSSTKGELYSIFSNYFCYLFLTIIFSIFFRCFFIGLRKRYEMNFQQAVAASSATSKLLRSIYCYLIPSQYRHLLHCGLSLGPQRFMSKMTVKCCVFFLNFFFFNFIFLCSCLL